jgi:hypothetical protein
MFHFLNKPYLFNGNLKDNTRIIFFISLGVFVFLFLFQPLQIDSLANREKYFLVIGLGIITFLSLSLNLLILPSLFPRILTGSAWNVKKEIIWDIWILFTICIGYFLYYKALGIMAFGFDMIVTMLLIAIVPTSVLITFNRNRLIRSHLKTANELNTKLKENKTLRDKLVHFVSDYKKDNLSVKVSLIILVRSANNYIEVFWKESHTVKRQMVRCSLTKAEELFADTWFMFKCHRSYLVNINHIDRVEGSQQGYHLYFEKVDFTVPVTKNYTHKLKELIG